MSLNVECYSEEQEDGQWQPCYITSTHGPTVTFHPMQKLLIKFKSKNESDEYIKAYCLKNCWNIIDQN